MAIIAQIIIVMFMVGLGVLIFRYTKFELKTQTITTVAMLILIAIALGTRYLTISLPFFGPESFEIKFDTIPIMFTGILFGPGWGFIAGLLTDLLQLVFSGVSFPFFGFTLNLVLTGVISGFIFSPKNKLSAQTMTFLTQTFISLLSVIAIMFITMNDTIQLNREPFHINTPLKITSSLIIFGLALLLIIYLYRKQNNIEDHQERYFVSRFSTIVVLCEIFIQMILTSLWLSIMFEVPWIIYMIPRIIEAILMIFIYVLIGQLLYRLIFKRLLRHPQEQG